MYFTEQTRFAMQL